MSRGLDKRQTSDGPEDKQTDSPTNDVEPMRLLGQIVRLSAGKKDVVDLGDQLLKVVCEQLHVDAAVVTLLHDQELCPLVWQGLDLSPNVCVDWTKRPWLATSLERGEACLQDEPLWRFEHDEPVTRVLVPLIFLGEPTGTLHLIKREREDAASLSALVAKQDGFLSTLGSFMSAALQNTRLYEEVMLERANLRAVIETIPEAVLLFNKRGQVLLFNSASSTLVGRKDWTILGERDHPFKLCDPRGRPVPLERWPLLRAVHSGETCTDEEFVLDFGDYRRHILLSVLPVTDDDGMVNSFVATAKDITKRSERDRRKDEFLSVASHELRSPLTPLTGLVQLARRQAERGEEVDLGLLTRADQQVRRLRRLIDSLLDVTRIETGQMMLRRQRTDLGALLKRIVDPWSLQAGGVEVRLTLPDEKVQAFLDPDRIDQVITNLIDNAVKHSKRGGLIEVTLSRSGSQAIVHVRDEGTGIAPELLARVFERFYQAGAGEGRSMGLGLYISREIIEQHHGQIAIESERDRYTQVTITLPLDPGDDWGAGNDH